MAKEFTGTATYESPKDKADAKDYADMRKVLQALQWMRGPDRWILKSPQHREQIGPLMATFPDAAVALTHRDPVAVIEKTCMCRSLRSPGNGWRGTWKSLARSFGH